jgi:hypothetical protein
MLKKLQHVEEQDCVLELFGLAEIVLDQRYNHLVLEVPARIAVAGETLDAHKPGTPRLHTQVQPLAYDRPVEPHSDAQVEH